MGRDFNQNQREMRSVTTKNSAHLGAPPRINAPRNASAARGNVKGKISVYRLLAAFPLMAAPLASLPASAGEPPSTASLVAEVRHTFTVDGKPIPPEIFRDFGDGDLADSGPIWVTIDVNAATGSNLYYDDIKKDGQWFGQKETSPKAGTEAAETGYSYYGATENGLLVVVASYSGGGSGNFITLHILDLAPARAFDLEGKVYDRLNLTNVRSVPLGDRWNGEIKIEKNTIRVITTRKGPADNSGKRETTMIEAKRP
jgi:hypothetical protein